jgi:hypothetical protein
MNRRETACVLPPPEARGVVRVSKTENERQRAMAKWMPAVRACGGERGAARRDHLVIVWRDSRKDFGAHPIVLAVSRHLNGRVSVVRGALSEIGHSRRTWQRGEEWPPEHCGSALPVWRCECAGMWPLKSWICQIISTASSSVDPLAAMSSI